MADKLGDEISRTPPIVMSEELVWGMDYFLRLTQLEKIHQVEIVTVPKRKDIVDVFVISDNASSQVNARKKLSNWLNRFRESLLEVPQPILEFMTWHVRGQQMVLKREEGWDCILPLHEGRIGIQCCLFRGGVGLGSQYPSILRQASRPNFRGLILCCIEANFTRED